MNFRYKHIFHTFAALLLCAAVSSCSQDEIDDPNGNIFSPDKYPLSLTASVGQMTSRADGIEPEPWVDGDIIRVRIYNPPTITNYPALGKYKLNTDGSVNESIDPIAWPDTIGYVKAWYPFFEIGETINKTISD